MKVPKIYIGDFIAVSAKDDQGDFTHQGQAVLLTENTVEFRTDVGIMNVKYADVNISRIKSRELSAEAPRHLVSFAREPALIHNTNKPTERKAREVRTDTKLAKAGEIYQKLDDKSRKNVIKAFMEQLNLSNACASTYQSICKKKYGK